ncbi:IS110 family transposase, partial [Lactobacillus salivarius]|nr:IS110 family transposase [Ligilactobacillus salivarius]
MKLNVGLDVSSEKLDACFLGDEPQDIYLEASFSNDTVGASQIKQKVLELNT